MGTIIGVIGGQKANGDHLVWAEQVGRLIAQRGGVLICGGLEGVMEAACKGAKEVGGITIGVIPGMQRSEANPFVTIPIVTGLSTARNLIIVRSAQALIAVGGSYGTLSEIAHALDLKKKVILLKSWDLRRLGADSGLLLEAHSPEEAVDLAFQSVEA